MFGCHFTDGLKTRQWIILCGIIPGLLVHPIRAFAQNVTLGWNVDNDPYLAGYALYYGTDGIHFTNRVDAGDNTVCTVSNLAPGAAYYFELTAYNVPARKAPRLGRWNISIRPFHRNHRADQCRHGLRVACRRARHAFAGPQHSREREKIHRTAVPDKNSVSAAGASKRMRCRIRPNSPSSSNRCDIAGRL